MIQQEPELFKQRASGATTGGGEDSVGETWIWTWTWTWDVDVDVDMAC